jgi:hypothetical protein
MTGATLTSKLPRARPPRLGCDNWRRIMMAHMQQTRGHGSKAIQSVAHTEPASAWADPGGGNDGEQLGCPPAATPRRSGRNSASRSERRPGIGAGPRAGPGIKLPAACPGQRAGLPSREGGRECPGGREGDSERGPSWRLGLESLRSLATSPGGWTPTHMTAA